jgi:hypothetical protein
MGPIERNRLIHVVNDVTNRSHIRIRSEITLKSCDGTLKMTEPDVKKGSKPDIQRRAHLCPLSGAKRTSERAIINPASIRILLRALQIDLPSHLLRRYGIASTA